MKKPRLKIALVEAPFGPVAWPSIGTSLLKSRLNDAGHCAQVRYLSLQFAKRVGLHEFSSLADYQSVSDSFSIHLGDWIFGPSAFPDAGWDRLDHAFLEALVQDGQEQGLIKVALAWRKIAAEFLDEQVHSTDWSEFDVIGFANSFSQLNASIGLANRIRAAHPNTKIIVGGCGCADPMGHGVMMVCDAFDAVVMGEGDDVILPLCEALACNEIPDLPGVLVRSTGGSIHVGPTTERVKDVNKLSIPDYDDYYAELPSSLKPELPHYIPIEASRGCWWGAKHHCTFCGLSPTKMPYFRKEPERFLSEVRTQTKRHAPRRFMAVDNIMPHEYYTEACPHIGAASNGAEFFFEVKANLDHEILDVFASNNISQIQPGIESLSTPVLKLMKKGTSGILNVYALRLAEERGIRMHWSILFGFEGELLDHYRHQVEVSRRIRHLRPPLGLVKCEVERFAPMYRFPEQHGLFNLRPSNWYYYSLPVPKQALDLIAYRFDADRSPSSQLLLEQIVELASQPIKDWKQSYEDQFYSLTAHPIEGGYLVKRQIGNLSWKYRLDGYAAELFSKLARPEGIKKLGVHRWWEEASPYLNAEIAELIGESTRQKTGEIAIGGADISDAFLKLLVHGLVIEEDGLALATPLFPVQTKRLFRVADQDVDSQAFIAQLSSSLREEIL
jgi:ribosomal peptide maturation radical SAM protein 1